MKSIFDYNDILNGTKGNAFNIGQLISKVIAVVVFLVTFGVGQKVYNWVNNSVTQVDASIDPIVRQPATSSGPNYKVV